MTKSLWRDRYKDLWCFLCPLCQTPRRIPFRANPGGFKHYFQVLLTALFFTILTWNWFSWKGIVSFLPFWASFEFFYRWRTRARLRCNQCGFDPYLFSIDVKWAKKEVEEHWRTKFAERGIPYPEPTLTPRKSSVKMPQQEA